MRDIRGGVDDLLAFGPAHRRFAIEEGGQHSHAPSTWAPHNTGLDSCRSDTRIKRHFRIFRGVASETTHATHSLISVMGRIKVIRGQIDAGGSRGPVVGHSRRLCAQRVQRAMVDTSGRRSHVAVITSPRGFRRGIGAFP